MKIEIYTDGSVHGSRMGYAAVALYGDRVREMGGAKPVKEPSPSVQAELLAVMLPLLQVRPQNRARCSVTIYTDCQAVAQALNARQGIVPHQVLVDDVRRALSEFESWEVQWIRKGSSPHNERAHVQANAYRRAAEWDDA